MAVAFEQLRGGRTVQTRTPVAATKSGEAPAKVIPFPQVATAKGPATPHSFLVGALPDWRLRLRRPMTVVIEKDDAFWLATVRDLEEFGYGPDPMSSVEDLQMTIVELYWSLKADKNRLSANLKEIWGKLQDLVEER